MQHRPHRAVGDRNVVPHQQAPAQRGGARRRLGRGDGRTDHRAAGPAHLDRRRQRRAQRSPGSPSPRCRRSRWAPATASTSSPTASATACARRHVRRAERGKRAWSPACSSRSARRRAPGRRSARRARGSRGTSPAARARRRRRRTRWSDRARPRSPTCTPTAAPRGDQLAELAPHVGLVGRAPLGAVQRIVLGRVHVAVHAPGAQPFDQPEPVGMRVRRPVEPLDDTAMDEVDCMRARDHEVAAAQPADGHRAPAARRSIAGCRRCGTADGHRFAKEHRMALKQGIVAFWKNYDRKAVLRAAQLGRGARLRLDLDSRGVGLRAVPAADRDRAGDQAHQARHRHRQRLQPLRRAAGDERRDARRDLRGPRHPRPRHQRQAGGRELPRRALREAAHPPARDDRHLPRAVARRAPARRSSARLLRRAPFQARDDAAARRPSRSTSPRCRRRRSARSARIADGWLPTFWPYRHLDGRHRADRARARAPPGRDADARSRWRRSSPSCRSTTSTWRARMIKPLVSFYIGGMGAYYHAMFCRYGFQETADRVRELYNSGKRREAGRGGERRARSTPSPSAARPRTAASSCRSGTATASARRCSTCRTGVPAEMVEQLLRDVAPLLSGRSLRS